MLKLNLNRYWVNEDTYKRIEHLLLETCGFVISQQGPKRWCEINKVWTLFENLDFEDEDTLISEWFEIINKSTNPYQLEEEVIDFLNNQYTGCHFGWVGDFDTYYSIGLRIGSWYLEIIKHDFPELFIMD